MRERKICVYALISVLSLSALSAPAPSPVPHLSEADKLDRQVEELSKAGKYSEAIPPATQSLHLREKALGPEHAGTATSLNNLAQLYQSMRDYAKAEHSFNAHSRFGRKRSAPNIPLPRQA
jgi:tetratricopeptide repeat protein